MNTAAAPNPFFDRAPIPLCLLAAGGDVLRANAQFARRFPPGVAPGGLPNALPEGCQPTLAALLRDAREHPGQPVEQVLVAPAAASADDLARWTVLWDDGAQHFYVAVEPGPADQQDRRTWEQAHEQLQLAQRVARMGSWSWIVGLPTAEWSDELYRIFGIVPPPDGAPITYERFLQAIHPDDRGFVDRSMSQLAERPGSYEMEYRVQRPDGQERAVLSRAVHFASAPVGRVVGIAQDISERKALENRLVQSQQLLNGVLGNAINGVLACRAVRDAAQRIRDFEILVANDAAARIARRSRQELIGSTILREFPGSVASGIFDKYVEVVETGSPISLEVFYGHEGLADWIHIVAGKFDDGFTAAFIDVTARKEAELELRQNRDRFEAIANYTYDWESWIDGNGRLAWTNPAVERITGYTAAECQRMPDFPFELIDPEDRLRLADLRTSPVAAEAAGDISFRIRRKDDSVCWVAASWQPIRDGDGHALGLRLSVRDISARRESELQREELLEQLQRTFNQIKTLSGLLPICAGCKKIHKDDGTWEPVEVYVRERSGADFSHGLCPACARTYFPEVAEQWPPEYDGPQRGYDD